MKTKDINIFMIILLLLPKPGYAGSTAEPHKQSESPIHELPKADQCSVITMQIRGLSYELKQVRKEISRLGAEINTAEADNTNDEQPVQENDQKLHALHTREKALREQLDLQERQLENCIFQTAMPAE